MAACSVSRTAEDAKGVRIEVAGVLVTWVQESHCFAQGSYEPMTEWLMPVLPQQGSILLLGRFEAMSSG